MTGFEEFLIIFFFLIFSFALYLIVRSNKHEGTELSKIQVLNSAKFSKLLYIIHYILLLSFVTTTAYAIWFGLRPVIYYVFFAALFVTSVFLALSTSEHRKNLAPRTLLITAVVLGICQSVLPTLENRLIIFGSDQWRDIVATKVIIVQGNFWNISILSNSYYSTAPFFNLLNSAVTLAIGDSFLSFTILIATLSLALVSAVYLILLRLTQGHLASVIAVFIFLSTPRLVLITALPSTVSLVLASISVLILVEHILMPRRSTLVASLLIGFSAMVFHPVGILVLILVCAGLVFTHFSGINKQTFLQSRTVRGLFALVCLVSIVYWSLNDVIFNSIISPLERLLQSIPTSLGSTAYTPQYFSGGFDAFSYAWALPVGLSAAYVLTTLYWLLKDRRNGQSKYREKLGTLPFVAGVIGLLLIAVGFLSVMRSPGAALERYINFVAYTLLLIPSAVLCARLIWSQRKFAALCLIVVLAAGVYIGSGSPDWAPFENSTFGAIHTTYTGYIEANTIVRLLPNNTPTLYVDNDIYSVVGVARLNNFSFTEPLSFQPTRNLLAALKAGTLNPYDPAYMNAHPNLIYVVKSGDVQNASTIDNYMDIVYNSGSHIMLMTPYNGTAK